LESDWVSVRIEDDNEQNEAGNITVDAPRPWEPLMFLSYNIHALTVNHILRNENPAASALLDPMSPDVDFSPLCRAVAIEGGAFLHACQTEVRSSGSPFFALRDDGQAVLVGIQAGASKLIASPCTASIVDNYPNYAVILPEGVRTRIRRE
jgi:hypothetical protein